MFSESDFAEVCVAGEESPAKKAYLIVMLLKRNNIEYTHKHTHTHIHTADSNSHTAHTNTHSPPHTHTHTHTHTAHENDHIPQTCVLKAKSR